MIKAPNGIQLPGRSLAQRPAECGTVEIQKPFVVVVVVGSRSLDDDNDNEGHRKRYWDIRTAALEGTDGLKLIADC